MQSTDPKPLLPPLPSARRRRRRQRRNRTTNTHVLIDDTAVPLPIVRDRKAVVSIADLVRGVHKRRGGKGAGEAELRKLNVGGVSRLLRRCVGKTALQVLKSKLYDGRTLASYLFSDIEALRMALREDGLDSEDSDAILSELRRKFAPSEAGTSARPTDATSDAALGEQSRAVSNAEEKVAVSGSLSSDDGDPAWVHPYEIWLRKSEERATLYKTFLSLSFPDRWQLLCEESIDVFVRVLSAHRRSGAPARASQAKSTWTYAATALSGSIRLESPQNASASFRLARALGHDRVLRVRYGENDWMQDRDYIRRMRSGWILVAGRRYETLCWKETTDVLVATRGPLIKNPLTPSAIYNWMGSFGGVRGGPRKLASRLALSCLSATVPALSWQAGDTPRLFLTDDITHTATNVIDGNNDDKDGIVLTDGCGLVSSDVALRLSLRISTRSDALVSSRMAMLSGSGATSGTWPTAFQIRCVCALGGFKGMLLCSPNVPRNSIVFRQSMRKFGPPRRARLVDPPVSQPLDGSGVRTYGVVVSQSAIQNDFQNVSSPHKNTRMSFIPTSLALDVCGYNQPPGVRNIIGCSLNQPLLQGSLSDSPMNENAIVELKALFTTYIDAKSTYPPDPLARLRHPLNQQLVLVLSAMGVDKKTFLDLLKFDYLMTVWEHCDARCAGLLAAHADSLPSDTWCCDGRSKLRKHLSDAAKTVSNEAMTLLDAGFHPSEPRVQWLLERANLRVFAGDFRAKIAMPGSALLYAAPDSTGTLRQGEVFIRVGGYTLEAARVLVTRSPCLHPSHVVELRAVDCKALGHLDNIAVFSTVTLGQPALGKMFGGDYDGDTVFCLWNPAVVSQVSVSMVSPSTANACSEAKSSLDQSANGSPHGEARCALSSTDRKHLQRLAKAALRVCQVDMLKRDTGRLAPKDDVNMSYREVKAIDAAKRTFLRCSTEARFAKGVLGNLHLRLAVELGLTASHTERAMRLFGRAVDAEKTGDDVSVPRDWQEATRAKRPAYPHFMRNSAASARAGHASRVYYRDKGVLGTLYDAAQRLQRGPRPIKFRMDQDVSTLKANASAVRAVEELLRPVIKARHAGSGTGPPHRRYDIVSLRREFLENDKISPEVLGGVASYAALPEWERLKLRVRAGIWYSVEYQLLADMAGAGAVAAKKLFGELSFGVCGVVLADAKAAAAGARIAFVRRSRRMEK